MPFVFLSNLSKNDALVKLVFDHLRNLGLCALIGSIGIWKFNSSATGLVFIFDKAIGFVVGMIAFGLFFLNYDYGFNKLQEMDAPSWLKIIIFIIYGFVCSEVFLFLLRRKF